MAKHAGYTIEVDDTKTAKSIGKELPISPKHAVEICREIRGMPLDRAKEFLEGVIAGRTPVPFRRYTYQVSHQRGCRGPGRFPKKAAQYILRVLEDAESNAEYKGFDTESLEVLQAAAHRGRTWHQRMPRAHGRWTQKDRLMTNIEVILQKREG
ncbi:MAG: 50S ribosomal protein L22 [Thermoplasmata archaeon]